MEKLSKSRKINNRVALFLPAMDGGGVTRVMLHVAEGLAEKGFNVDLLLAKAPLSSLDRPLKNVRILILSNSPLLQPMTRLIGWLTQADYFAEALAKLPSLIRYLKHSPPITLFSGSANLVVIWASILASFRGRTLVTVAVHQSTHYGVVFSGIRQLLPRLHHWFLSWADGVVAESEGIAEDLADRKCFPAKRVWVIHNPVVTPEMLAKACEEVDHPWLTDGGCKIVLGVGRLMKQKDFPNLIRAFKIVRGHHSVKLIILGEGPDRMKIERLIREMELEADVSLPGFQSNPYAYMAKASVFVLSSRWEGFGNVLAEALAVGTPVVSTDCQSGPSEILADGKFGKLVPVGNPEALAEAISVTLINPPDKSALKARGRAFSLEAALPKFIVAMGLENQESF